MANLIQALEVLGLALVAGSLTPGKSATITEKCYKENWRVWVNGIKSKHVDYDFTASGLCTISVK